VGSFGGEGAAFARYTLYKKMAAAYREIMVNTKDSPIMQIFQTFNAPGNPGHKPGVKLGTPEKITPTSPPNPAPRAASLTRSDSGSLGNASSSPRPSGRSQGDKSHE
jgi:hypothetical protein